MRVSDSHAGVSTQHQTLNYDIIWLGVIDGDF